MKKQSPTGRHRHPVRMLIAALAMLAAVLATQSVPPPAGASGTSNVEISINLSVKAELDDAGLVLWADEGASFRIEGSTSVLSLPEWYPTTYGYDATGRRTATTPLLGRLDVWSWRSGAGVSMTNLEVVMTEDAPFPPVDLYGRVNGGERIRIGWGTTGPNYNIFFADPYFALLASYIAETPVFTRTAVLGNPPPALFGGIRVT